MSKLYVLTVETSLPYTAEYHRDLDRDLKIFTSFDAAKRELFEQMKRFSSPENGMFDEDGNLKNFRDYCANLFHLAQDDADTANALAVFTSIQEAIKKLFSGNPAETLGLFNNCKKDPHDEYDYLLVTCENDILSVSAVFDGPANGYDPTIYTNMFKMEEEKNYFLYIDDNFGQFYDSHKLYIHLDIIEMK